MFVTGLVTGPCEGYALLLSSAPGLAPSVCSERVLCFLKVTGKQ